MVRVGITDTTFSRVDMGGIAERKLHNIAANAQLVRFTVPGVKDLPVAAQRLFMEDHCDIVIACGMVGPEAVDKVCGHEASTAIQHVQLTQGKHVLEVFVHMGEARDDADMIQLATNRVEKHCENAVALLQSKTTLTANAGQGKRQGREDAGTAKARAPSNSPRLGFVVSEFNPEVTSVMEAEAKRAAQAQSAPVIAVLHVPGAYDSPLAVQQLLKRQDIDAVCVYGAIIKGDTYHDQVIGHTTAKTLQELSLKFSKPVAFGIAGPGMTDAQAEARSMVYGKRAVDAAVRLWRELQT